MVAERTSITSTELEGRVVRTNDHGLVLDGRRDWLNYSKFGTFVTLPQAGDVVRLTLDKAGFIRSVETLTPAPEPRQLRPTGAQNGHSEGPDKDTTITRLACLKAASVMFTYRAEATAADILQFAEQFEQWVVRP